MKSCPLSRKPSAARVYLPVVITFSLIFVFLLNFRKLYAQENLNKGLAAYYPFDNSINDESGNNNNPSASSISFTTDRFGNPKKACKFNGSSNYIRVPDSKSLHFKNGMSISAWVRVDGYYSGKCHGNRIIMKGSSDYLDGNFFLTFDDNHYTDGENCYRSRPDETHQLFYAPSTSPVKNKFIKTGQWYHLTFVYDGYNARLYAGCELVASGTIRNYNFTNYDDLLFGRMDNGQYPYWFNGALDEVRIYNRPLNQDEIKALCNLSQPAAQPKPDPCTGTAKPSAKFDYSITDCNTVNFRLLAVNTNNLKSIKWSFGDGKTSTEKKPSHTYSRFGSFKVKAIVTNKTGCSDTITKEIKLAALTTDFVVTEKGEPGAIQFRAKNNKASYSWDFADGNTAGNETMVSHLFTTTGNYSIRMFAKNHTGCTDTVSKNIFVQIPESFKENEPTIETTDPTPVSAPLVTTLEKREKDIIRTIAVASDSLRIALYDNGIIDGDSVTIIYNNNVLIAHQPLSEKPVVLHISVDKNAPVNELIMYADNIGSIPPNTALMVVYDGNERHSVIISSTNKTSGAIAFTRQTW